MEGITISWSNKEIKPISWNSLYSQKHFSYRKKLKDQWKAFFKSKLSEFDKLYAEKFEIVLRVNSRADIDNVGIMAKFFSDCLTTMGWVQDDSPKFYKKFTIISDKENLPYNHFEITYKPI